VTRRGLALFAAMCVIWGIPYLLIRVAVLEISPATLVFLRTAIAFVILVPFALRRGGWRALAARWPALVIFSAVEVGGPWFLLSSAEQHISSALSGLLISAVPLVGVVIATASGNREHLGFASVCGFLLGVAGVGLIVGLDVGGTDVTALIEIALVVIGYATGPAILTRFLTGVPSLTVNSAVLALVALAYAPVAALTWPTAVPSAQVFGAVAVLAIVCTALAFIVFFALIAEVGPVRATVITYVNPAVAAILGALVLHESLTVWMGIGFALVLAGSALATRRAKPSPEPAPPAVDARHGEAVTSGSSTAE
jgi:drug/metabolite transporter (DMT)-like permease